MTRSHGEWFTSRMDLTEWTAEDSYNGVTRYAHLDGRRIVVLDRTGEILFTWTKES